MKKTVRKRVNQKQKKIVGSKVSYVGKYEKCWARIVLFEWIILEDLWDKVKCKMIDKYIYVPNTPFEATFFKNQIKFI